MIKRDDSPRKNGNSELLNTRSYAKSAGFNSKTLKNDDHTVGIINKSPKREPTNEKKSSKFSWKILFCGFNSHGVNLNDKDKTSSIKRWKFREIIFKKNSNVLKILQLSRKTDDDIALKILSPVPATDELVNLNNDVLTQNKDENLPNIKNLLLPIEESDRNKKCLIIDLDETLVHSSFKYVDRADFKVGVEIEGIVHQVYVLKRPFVDEFLTALGDLFECVLFTASLSKYADPVADFIDKNRVFRHRLFREACVYHVGSYVKDLSLLGRPLDQVVILDNSPASFLFHPNNAVQISSWFDDTSDTALLDLIPYFVSMAKNADVPNYLDAHDPDTPCAAIGCKGLSTNPLPSNNSCNSSNNNVITQLDNCSTSENNFSSQTIASCISHKQHENYNMTQKNISTTTNDLEKTSSNYPIVKRKQLNSVGKTTVDSTNKRHQSSHQGKTNDVKGSVGRKAVTSSPKSDASLEHAEKKTDVASSTQKARLIISETNQMRKDKFLKEKRTT